MLRVSILKRVQIALVGYGVLALFGLVFFALRRNFPTLTMTQHLILSGVAVAPLMLALLWEHLKGVKVGQVEITLNEVTPTLHFELASQIQNLEASVTPALGAAMRAAVGRSEFELVEINLRSTPYWWSTRVYLLAALAEEYTNIERLVFVEQDAARVFVGIAAPAAVRKAFARTFPDLQRVFRSIQQNVLDNFKPTDLVTEVEAILPRFASDCVLFVFGKHFYRYRAFGKQQSCSPSESQGSMTPNSFETVKYFGQGRHCIRDFSSNLILGAIYSIHFGVENR